MSIEMSVQSSMKLALKMDQFKTYMDSSKMEHKSYQYEGVKWILQNELKQSIKGKKQVRGGIIADEMGLGKTIMMIGTMLCNFVPKTLIVVPPILINQWFLQIYKTTGHKALIYHGSTKQRITEEQLNSAIIVITTYGGVTLNKKQLAKNNLGPLHQIKWSRIVFDEAHHLRNSNTIRNKSVKLLKTNIRWMVTGTPIQNSKKDFQTLCGLVGIQIRFEEGKEAILKKMLKQFVLRRTKKSVGIEMTEIISSKNVILWQSSREMALSQEIHSALGFSNVSLKETKRTALLDLMENSDGGKLLLLLRARQTCIYPNLISKMLKDLSTNDADYYRDTLKQSSKLDFVTKKILERKGNGNGKLVFCHFRDEMDEIIKRLQAGGIERVVSFDGRTSAIKRVEILNEKNEVLVLQIQTGCEGLNLQEDYSEIYFVSPHWNPAVEDQAIARCHRIGQKKPVYVEHFVMSQFTKEKNEEDEIEVVDNVMELMLDQLEQLDEHLDEDNEDDISKSTETFSVDDYVISVQERKKLIAEEIIQVH